MVSTVRPNLNAVAIVPDWVGNSGICSTGFAVLRANNTVIYTRFLFSWVKSLPFINDISNKARGANYPAVSFKDILDSKIPVPPLEEQEYIVEILQQADKLRQLRQDSLAKADKLSTALFLETFGNILINDKNWKTVKLEKLCTLVRGSSPRPQGDPRYYGGNIPRLMVADLTRDGIYVSPQIDSLTEEGAKKSRPMVFGDVVMAVSGAPGLSAILKEDACIHDGFVGFRNLKKGLLPEYFVGVLGAMKVMNEQQAMGAVFLNLKTQQIKLWKIPVPPMELQKKYVEIFLSQYEQLQLMMKNTDFLDEFFNQINFSAFTGKLSEIWREKHQDISTPSIKHKPVKPSILETSVLHSGTSISQVSNYQIISWQERRHLINRLSPFQKTVLQQFSSSLKYVTEDMKALLFELPNNFSDNDKEKLKRTLQQLNAMGFLSRVSIENGEGEYITAYRRVNTHDQSKEADLSLLKTLEAVTSR